MARQTRAQRRARRQQQAESRATAQQTDGRSRPAVPSPARAQVEEPREAPEHVPGRRSFRFVHESVAELKKVDWPGQSQVIQATTVVLLACAIVGVYLWGADLVLKRLVEKVFLGQ